MKTRIAAYLLVGISVLWPTNAKAQALGALETGNDLYEGFQACDRAKRPDIQADMKAFGEAFYRCTFMNGFVWGIARYLNVHGQLSFEGLITAEQVFDIVRTYLKDHPESRNLRGALLVENALRKAFPSKADNGGDR